MVKKIGTRIWVRILGTGYYNIAQAVPCSRTYAHPVRGPNSICDKHADRPDTLVQYGVEIHMTEDEVSEERELSKPNFQISMVNPEWQKLTEDLEAQKSALKGEKKVQSQGHRSSVRLNKASM